VRRRDSQLAPGPRSARDAVPDTGTASPCGRCAARCGSGARAASSLPAPWRAHVGHRPRRPRAALLADGGGRRLDLRVLGSSADLACGGRRRTRRRGCRRDRARLRAGAALGGSRQRARGRVPLGRDHAAMARGWPGGRERGWHRRRRCGPERDASRRRRGCGTRLAPGPGVPAAVRLAGRGARLVPAAPERGRLLPAARRCER